MPRAPPLSDHHGLGRDGPQHRRVLGGVELADRLHVAYDDISVVRLGDAVAERLERLDGLLDPLLEHGTRIDPQPEVPAPKAWRDAQHVVDYGDGLDVGVDVERHHGVLDERAHPLRVCHRVSDRDQARLEIHIAPPKAADLADSHPRVQGEYDRPLILGGPIESELLSGILFAHDFEKVSGLATKGEA